MRVLRSFNPSLGCTIAALMSCAFINPAALSSKELPSDICALLPATQLQKVLDQPFGMPERSTAPAAFRGQPSGTQCRYKAQQGGVVSEVVLIVYVDPSAAEAKETYDKLSVWFAPKSKPAGIGDAAYIDNKEAIHVLKGKVRYYINIISKNPGAPVQEKSIDLASSVAAQI